MHTTFHPARSRNAASHLRTLTLAMTLTCGAAASAAPVIATLPGDLAYPESVTSTADGTLYVGSLAAGGIYRIPSGAAQAEIWIKPGTYDTRSTLGIVADEASRTLWVCSNDVSAMGIPGPGSVKGSALKGFDLATGEGKISVTLPGTSTLCNDIAIGPDKSIYVTNTFAPQILRMKPGSNQFEVWATHPDFEPPKNGGGLDGIAFGRDGNLYVNTYSNGELFRVDVKDGAPGKVTKLQTSQPIALTDALRPTNGPAMLMVEGGGKLDRVTINGDMAVIETLRDGLVGPTGVTLVNDTAWVTEGQLGYLLDPSKKGQTPALPFKLYAVKLPGK